MSALRSHPALRWLVPATAALAVIGGGAAIGALTAAAEPSLPPRSAAQLLVDLQSARLDGLSGTIVARADLGLPALPGIAAPRAGQGSADLGSLVAGTHTLRVWYSGPHKARVALLGTLGETDVITNGTDVWIWSSRENKATHQRLPGRERAGGPGLAPTGAALTPQQLADAALAAIDPSTKVSTDGSAKVAGRAAYELVLSPRDAASRIGSVRLAIDAEQHVPLRVRVYSTGGADPAIEVAFTQVSFARPDDAQFTFNPPPGATVVDEGTGTPRTKPDPATPGSATPGSATPGAPTPDPARPEARGTTIVGKGWTSVLVARIPKAGTGPGGDAGPAGKVDGKSVDGKSDDKDGAAGLPGMLASILERLPKVSGAWGSGRLFTSTLFTVLVTDDGRILVGAVSPERLYQAAGDPAAKVGGA